MTAYSAPVGAPDLVRPDEQRAGEGRRVLPGPLRLGGRRSTTRVRRLSRTALHGKRVAGLDPYMAEGGGPSDIWSLYLRTDDPETTPSRTSKPRVVRSWCRPWQSARRAP